MTKPNKSKIILDLCGATGAWSKPYADAGYDVRIITLPEQNVIDYIPPFNVVYGILAAPPCDHFARVGARWWQQKGIKALHEGLAIVDACLRIIIISKPKFWALENPIGRLKDYLGEPKYKFDPWYFGDFWTKRTWLWGDFNCPQKHTNSIRPILIGKPKKRDRTVKMSSTHKKQRSITPAGFAQAFFEANR